jgi:hypothetical protein
VSGTGIGRRTGIVLTLVEWSGLWDHTRKRQRKVWQGKGGYKRNSDWTVYFTHLSCRNQQTDFNNFWHIWWSHRRCQLNKISSRSVKGFWLGECPNIVCSHRKAESSWILLNATAQFGTRYVFYNSVLLQRLAAKQQVYMHDAN